MDRNTTGQNRRLRDHCLPAHTLHASRDIISAGLLEIGINRSAQMRRTIMHPDCYLAFFYEWIASQRAANIGSNLWVAQRLVRLDFDTVYNE